MVTAGRHRPGLQLRQVRGGYIVVQPSAPAPPPRIRIGRGSKVCGDGRTIVKPRLRADRHAISRLARPYNVAPPPRRRG